MHIAFTGRLAKLSTVVASSISLSVSCTELFSSWISSASSPPRLVAEQEQAEIEPGLAKGVESELVVQAAFESAAKAVVGPATEGVPQPVA